MRGEGGDKIKFFIRPVSLTSRYHEKKKYKNDIKISFF